MAGSCWTAFQFIHQSPGIPWMEGIFFSLWDSALTTHCIPPLQDLPRQKHPPGHSLQGLRKLSRQRRTHFSHYLHIRAKYSHLGGNLQPSYKESNTGCDDANSRSYRHSKHTALWWVLLQNLTDQVPNKESPLKSGLAAGLLESGSSPNMMVYETEHPGHPVAVAPVGSRNFKKNFLYAVFMLRPPVGQYW